MLAKGSSGTAQKREDPRVKGTRKPIVRAFGELVAEKGHRGLTVQEITERATVNRGQPSTTTSATSSSSWTTS